ncbi:MAG: hypothetical protein MUE71_03730 [Chitinophagaceae bacterium]|nr:hypothetical protein [Chitinophagaceae bacterium]
MNRISPVILAIFSAFLFSSCEKEYSIESDSVPGPPVLNGLLISAEVEDPQTKTSLRYDYNASGKITKNYATINAGAISADVNITASRDGSGNLSGSTVVIKSSFLPDGDTLNYKLFRNGSGRVVAMTIKPNDNGGPIAYDSTVYTYNASNRIASYVVYGVTRNAPGVFVVIPYEKYEFIYTGENVTRRSQYELNGSVSNAQLLETLDIEYDNKPAARVLTEEEYMLELSPVNGFVPSVNNMVKITSNWPDSPDDNYVSTYVYTYGTNEKPSSAVVTTTYNAGGGSVSNIKFTYN